MLRKKKLTFEIIDPIVLRLNTMKFINNSFKICIFEYLVSFIIRVYFLFL